MNHDGTIPDAGPITPEVYLIEAESADLPQVRDAVVALGDSGWHPSAILPVNGGRIEVYHWHSKVRAENAAARLTGDGVPSRVRKCR